MMKDLSYYIPACTPDLDGAVSMLAPMGGMVILHDAAGCMENYVLYEEPRWFGMDAMVYSSSLLQLDAVLGNEEPLIEQTAAAVKKLHPAFVALVGSPVPAVTGMDLNGIASEIEFRSQTPAFAISCSGFRTYAEGAGAALKELVRRYAQPAEVCPGTVNLLGATPLDFSPHQLQALNARLEEAGWTVHGCFCMDFCMDQLATMAKAQHNLVVSRAGLPAAKLAQRKFGTPYTELYPLTVSQAKTLRLSCPEDPIQQPRALIVAEPVLAQSLADALLHCCRIQARILPDWTAEAELIPQLRAPWDMVVGDPLLKALCPPQTRFIAWPHRALSSHLYEPGDPAVLNALLAPK